MKKKIIPIIITIMVITAVYLILFMPRKYYIPEHVLAVNNNTAEDGVNYFTMYEAYFDYSKVYVGKNSSLVFVLTREQREEFLNYVENILQDYKQQYEKEGTIVSYSESYTEIIIECKSTNVFYEINSSDLNGIIAGAGFYQGFIGVKPEDNKVTLKVIDTDTNEVIYEKTLEAP